eukprot:5724965-Amphidinium_carterae.1
MRVTNHHVDTPLQQRSLTVDSNSYAQCITVTHHSSEDTCTVDHTHKVDLQQHWSWSLFALIALVSRRWNSHWNRLPLLTDGNSSTTTTLIEPVTQHIPAGDMEHQPPAERYLLKGLRGYFIAVIANVPGIQASAEFQILNVRIWRIMRGLLPGYIASAPADIAVVFSATPAQLCGHASLKLSCIGSVSVSSSGFIPLSKAGNGATDVTEVCCGRRELHPGESVTWPVVRGFQQLQKPYLQEARQTPEQTHTQQISRHLLWKWRITMTQKNKLTRQKQQLIREKQPPRSQRGRRRHSRKSLKCGSWITVKCNRKDLGGHCTVFEGGALQNRCCDEFAKEMLATATAGEFTTAVEDASQNDKIRKQAWEFLTSESQTDLQHHAAHGTLFWNGRGTIPPELLEGKDGGDAKADEQPHVEFGLMGDDVLDAVEPPILAQQSSAHASKALVGLEALLWRASASDLKAAAEL